MESRRVHDTRKIKVNIMRNMKCFIGIIFLIFSTISCSKEDLTDELYMLVDYKYHIPNQDGLFTNKSLYVKTLDGKSEDQDWTPFINDEIEGFDYEEGYTYKLLVLRTFLKSPPQDSADHSYKLIKIIEKIKY